MSNLKYMAKSPLILAALATEALPHYRFKQARPLTAAASGLFDSALLTAEDGSAYVVKMAASETARVELASELRALRTLDSNERSRLGFEVPSCLGETSDMQGNSVQVFNFISGDSTEITSVPIGSELASSIATAIASVHRISPALVDGAGLPNITVAEHTGLRVAELDRIASTGQVPSILLSRWEAALEDTSLFGYRPTVIHGSMNGEIVLNDGKNVTGILGWSALRISDPAEDFAWILGAGIHDLADEIVSDYDRLTGNADQGLKIRATLYSEIELARWLMHGIARKDQSIIADASALLALLAEEIESGAVGALSLSPIAATAASFGLAVAEADPNENEVEPLPELSFGFSTESIEFIDSGVTPEVSEETPVAEVAIVEKSAEDTKTRPIELPERSENELF